MTELKGKKIRTPILALASVVIVVIAGASVYAVSEGSGSSGGGISVDEAKRIALEKVAGASESDIVKAHKDYDDGRQEYEVEIRYNGYEYDYEIDAETGNIISSDVDRIDYDD